MVVLNGRFDGRQIVIEGQVPQDIPADTPVRIIFDSPSGSGDGALSKIASLAKPGNQPADFAEQHEHYSKGTPRR